MLEERTCCNSNGFDKSQRICVNHLSDAFAYAKCVNDSELAGVILQKAVKGLEANSEKQIRS